MIFTACICAIILTGCGSKYTVEEKSLVENQKENQETLENGVNRTSMEKSIIVILQLQEVHHVRHLKLFLL